MDNPKIDVPREAPPNWARADARTVALGSEPVATTAQLNFMRSLVTQKDLRSLSVEQRAALQQPEEFWDTDTTRLTKAKASRILDLLTQLPNRPKEDVPTTNWMAERFAVGIPAGRYAVENADGELRFYTVWVSRDKKRLNVYVAHGPDDSELKHHKTTMSVLNKIKGADFRQCAIRYGLEIGECSNCGRRLTNRISRELGIGPVCGGRMFGDEYKVDVKIKRAEIVARGEDPDEVFEDE